MRATFTKYVEDSYDTLLRFARLMTGDQEAGADLTQQALLRLWEYWPRLRDIRAANAYARRVMVTTLVSDQRTRRVRTTTLDDSGQNSTPDPNLEERFVVWNAVVALPAQQRACVVLRYYVGHSIGEIADTLDCSTVTVATHLRRAKRHLGHSLRELDTDTNIERTEP